MGAASSELAATIERRKHGRTAAEEARQDGYLRRSKVMMTIVMLGLAAVALDQLLEGWPTSTRGVLLAAGAGLTTLLLAGGLTILHWKGSSLQRIRTAGAVAAVTFTLYNLLRIYLTGDAQTAALVMLLLGTAAVFTSTWWLLSVWSICLGGWYVVALTQLPPAEFRYWALCSSAALAISGTGALLTMRRRHARDEAEEQRMQAEQEREAERERLRRAVAGTHDGLWHWDLNSDVFHASAGWEQLLGYREGELGTRPAEWFKRVHPGYLADLKQTLKEHLEGATQQFRHEHRMLRQDGSYVWMLARAVAVRDAKGKAIAIAGSHTEMSDLIDVERSLLDDAFQDKLTSLPNRHFLMARLETVIEDFRKATRGSHGPFALLFLDLDKFKLVNDTWGHLVGDQLLMATAGRLRHCTSQSDIVARFAGDEFVVLLTGIRDTKEAMSTARRIAAALAEPYNLSGNAVNSGGSIGVAFSREQYEDGEDLLRMADAAMYRAKAVPSSRPAWERVCLFEPGMISEEAQAAEFRNDLTRALQREELELHYQPVVSLESGGIVSVEALLRWRRRSKELLPASEFMQIAEDAGLMQEIGAWVLREACLQNVAWQDAGLGPVKVAVNLSARQLRQSGFVDLVAATLRETTLDPKWLELELTETALLANEDQAPEVLAELSAMGVHISIDNFGTGNIPLDKLRRFEFRTLKIDQTLVSGVTQDKKAAAVARGVISMAHYMDLAVVAEGVEEHGQLQFLAEEMCDQMQGFLASHPLPAGQMTELLRDSRSKPLLPSPEKLPKPMGPASAQTPLSAKENKLRVIR